MRTPLIWGLGLLTLLGFSGAAAKQQGQRPSSTDVQDVQLRLTTSATVYRQGEVIPVTLSFTSSVPNRYKVNQAMYDRSGRMWYDHFFVEPSSGASDPLGVYFESLGATFLGGLSTPPEFLSNTPYIIHLNLNEWVRFDKPGRYRISVRSGRVTDTSLTKDDKTVSNLQSNLINLQIIEPDQAWQQAHLEKILADFDASPAPTLVSSSPQRIGAITALRYLGSAEAARELARHLRGEEGEVDWNCMFGLVGSPNRLAGYDELKRLMTDRDFPVSDMFLVAMSVVPLVPGEPPETLRKEREDNWKNALSATIAAAPNKRGKAEAATVNTALLDADSTNYQGDLRNLLPLLIAHFGDLTLQQQARWLGDQWSKIKDPAWLPIVRPIATAYTDFPKLREAHAYDSLTLSGSALVRWYELDPVSARPTVLAEITRPKPRYRAATLGMLPDATLPNEEHAIAEHFLATDNYEIEGNLASLLNRYADASVLAEVLPKIEKKTGHWACDPQNASVTYLQRVAPEEGKRLLERVTPECRRFNDSSVRR